MVRTIYCQQCPTERTVQAPKRIGAAGEVKTYFNSKKMKTYFHPVQSKLVRVDFPQQQRDMILNEKRLDDTIINRSQNIHAKQFPNIGGWQDILLF